jgi:TPP-dependent indolepyruvate ferredoxin oxidoreductase alpha subunit
MPKNGFSRRLRKGPDVRDFAGRRHHPADAGRRWAVFRSLLGGKVSVQDHEAVRLLSGNEAIARGAYEAGVKVAAAYPGTPSTEILEYLAEYDGVHAEWAPNEKVAVEVALGAAMAGARALAAMKHVGVNVAADPIFTASYTGVRGGLVIVTADDPEMHSSQNEQDNRHYAIAAKIPMLEPTDSAETKEYTKLAFPLSERFDTPVFLRTTTRVSHATGVVRLGEIDPPQAPLGFVEEPAKWVMLPVSARKRHVVVEGGCALRGSETAEPDRVGRPVTHHHLGLPTSTFLRPSRTPPS